MTKRQANIFKAIKNGCESAEESLSEKNTAEALKALYDGRLSRIEDIARAYMLYHLTELENPEKAEKLVNESMSGGKRR